MPLVAKYKCSLVLELSHAISTIDLKITPFFPHHLLLDFSCDAMCCALYNPRGPNLLHITYD